MIFSTIMRQESATRSSMHVQRLWPKRTNYGSVCRMYFSINRAFSAHAIDDGNHFAVRRACVACTMASMSRVGGASLLRRRCGAADRRRATWCARRCMESAAAVHNNQAYERGLSFFCLNSDSSATPATFTICARERRGPAAARHLEADSGNVADGVPRATEAGHEHLHASAPHSHHNTAAPRRSRR